MCCGLVTDEVRKEEGQTVYATGASVTQIFTFCRTSRTLLRLWTPGLLVTSDSNFDQQQGCPAEHDMEKICAIELSHI